MLEIVLLIRPTNMRPSLPLGCCNPSLFLRNCGHMCPWISLQAYPSYSRDVIFLFVDRLSKYAHYVLETSLYSYGSCPGFYLDHVFRLHGWPRSIVSDRDSFFISDFWHTLFTFQGTTLQLSSAYHPQFDGQTEVVNKCLETYLRYMIGECFKE